MQELIEQRQEINNDLNNNEDMAEIQAELMRLTSSLREAKISNRDKRIKREHNLKIVNQQPLIDDIYKYGVPLLIPDEKGQQPIPLPHDKFLIVITYNNTTYDSIISNKEDIDEKIRANILKKNSFRGMATYEEYLMNDDNYRQSPIKIFAYPLREHETYTVAHKDTIEDINCLFKIIDPENAHELTKTYADEQQKIKFSMIDHVCKILNVKLIIKNLDNKTIHKVNPQLKGKSKVIKIYNNHAFKDEVKTRTTITFNTYQDLIKHVKTCILPVFYINDNEFITDNTKLIYNAPTDENEIKILINSILSKLTPINYTHDVYNYVLRAHNYYKIEEFQNYDGLAFQFDQTRSFTTAHNLIKYNAYQKYPLKLNQFIAFNNEDVLNYEILNKTGFTEISEIKLFNHATLLENYFKRIQSNIKIVVANNVLRYLYVNKLATFKIHSALYSIDEVDLRFNLTDDKLTNNVLVGLLTPDKNESHKVVINNIHDLYHFQAKSYNTKLIAKNDYVLLEYNINQNERPQYTHIKNYILGYTLIKQLILIEELNNKGLDYQDIIKMNIDAVYYRADLYDHSTVNNQLNTELYKYVGLEHIYVSNLKPTYTFYKNCINKTPQINRPYHINDLNKNEIKIYNAYAGAGKTKTLMQEVSKYNKVLMCVPTNQLRENALKYNTPNLIIQTYHTAFDIPINYIHTQTPTQQATDINLITHDVEAIILDEIGMIPEELYYKILEKTYNKYRLYGTYGIKQLSGFINGTPIKDVSQLLKLSIYNTNIINITDSLRCSPQDQLIRIQLTESKQMEKLQIIQDNFATKTMNELIMHIVEYYKKNETFTDLHNEVIALCNTIQVKTYYNYQILKYLRTHHIQNKHLIPCKVKGKIKMKPITHIKDIQEVCFINTTASMQGSTVKGSTYIINDYAYNQETYNVSYTRSTANDKTFTINDIDLNKIKSHIDDYARKHKEEIPTRQRANEVLIYLLNKQLCTIQSRHLERLTI